MIDFFRSIDSLSFGLGVMFSFVFSLFCSVNEFFVEKALFYRRGNRK